MAEQLPVLLDKDASAQTARNVEGGGAAKSGWPGVQHRLGEFPFKVAATCAFVLGCAMLYAYLVSIGYVPSDLLSLFGLATLTSVWLLLFWVLVTVAMFGAVFSLSAYEVEPPNAQTLFVGQLSGALLGIWWVLKASSMAVPFGIAGGVFTVLLFFLLWAEKPRRSFFFFALTVLALILGGALVPLGVYILVFASGISESPPVSWYDWRLLVGLVLLLSLLAVNTAASRSRVPSHVFWAIGATSVAVLFLVMTGWYVPAVLAERVGVRLPGVVTLSVPKNTCALIFSATEGSSKHADAGPVPGCAEEHSFVRAQVQLRWSGRLLLVVKSVNGMNVRDDSPRVTIPDDGTQLILHR